MTIIVVAMNGLAVVTPHPIALVALAVAKAQFEATVVSTQ